MKKNFLVCLLLCITVTAVGCTQQPVTTSESTTNDLLSQEQVENGKELHIVTTFPPLYAHTANIIDGNDTLTNLVPPGSSVHTWQPKPSDLVAMEKADVIITNGLGLEEFLENYLETLEKKGVVIVDTSEGVSYIDTGDEGEEEEHNEDEHEDHDDDDHEDEHNDHHHEGPDPHIRLSIDNTQIQLENIVTALIEADGTQEVFYNEQAAVYSKTLSELDSTIKEDILASNVQPFIVFHDAYQYFLQAYNLENKQVGLVQEFHGDSPSQKAIAELIEIITVNKVTTIYTEPQFNPSVVKSLEQETGVQAREIDPIGKTIDKNGYIETMVILAEAFIKN